MHHSSSDAELEALLKAEAEQEEFGETGKFPDGKLTDSDEGEIKFGVAAYGSQVLLNFGKPVAWFAMDADHADSLGDLLKHKAEETRKYVIGQTKG